MWPGRCSSSPSSSTDNDPLRKKQKKDNIENASDSVASASDSADCHLLPLPIGEYEVFLSFRGPDTRYQIIDVLYQFLTNLKIRTFKDEDKLDKGEWIWPSLLKAIKQSKIYIPVFSENYAASKWCLRELAAIVEHRKENPGCVILPIFHMMDPRDVRHQMGPYEKAFQQHKEDFDGKTIQSWKDALNEVGAMKGWHVKNNDEQGTLADLVTGVVWEHLSKSNSILKTDKLIGIDDHIEVVKGKLALDSPCMTIVGIHGIGGIGKTTIAEAVYNKVSPQFDRCSFVEDVREMLQEKNGIVMLQKHIISDILRETESISSRREGIRIIQDRISCFKFLIVLDDVDENFEFDKILGNVENFNSGSRFIITSRNVKVLSTLTDDCKLYRVREMNDQYSLQLFCKHAFKMDSPKSGWETLSEDFVSVAAGLPLTLKVVGSLLYKEEEAAIWEDKLRRLKEIPEEEVMERLKISYKTLNKETKQIFLDIACFFIGEDKELPSYMWSSCDFFPVAHINILEQRSLIELGSDYPYKKEKAFPMHYAVRDISNKSVDCSFNLKKVFLMHDQLRDMGREIVRRKCIGNSLKRSRIWSEEKASDMLLDRKGTKHVKGIRVYSNCFEEEIGKISQECFMNLSEMRYMEMEARMPINNFHDNLPDLRWLRLSIGLGECIPRFSVKNLVILELLSSVKDEWGALRDIKMASKLKVLKLSGYLLDEFPKFPRSGSLEILDMTNCFHFLDRKELDIGNLGNLKVMRLEDCGVREITGGTVGMMPLGNINVLHLFPSSLTTLFLMDCRQLEWLPSLEKLENLTHLSIQGCPLIKEILGVGGLKSLETLHLTRLVAARNLDGLDCLYSLKSLSLEDCDALERLPSMASLSKLLHLYISWCCSLTEIQGLGGMESLQTLSIDDAQSLSCLFGLETLLFLNKLESLKIDCPLLTLPSFSDLDDGRLSKAPVLNSLRMLYICGTTQALQIFSRMIQLFMFPSVTKLTLFSWRRTGSADMELRLDGLESMEELVELHLYSISAGIPSLSKLGNLKSLFLTKNQELREIEGLAGLTSLEHLNLNGCTFLERLPADDLYGLEQLKSLDISRCRYLSDPSALSNLEPRVKIEYRTREEEIAYAVSGFDYR